MNYLLHLLILVEIYLILSSSLNLMLGYTGLVSLAHAAFYGFGAYISTLLMVDAGVGFFASMAVAVVVTMLLSVLITFASLRFRGDYFILVTLAFQVITFTVLNNWTSVTSGPYGIAGIPPPVFAGVKVDSVPSFAFFGFICMLLVVAFLIFVVRSPFGRTLQAIRDNELAALSLGKNVVFFKLRSIAISSAMAAVAGVLYATYISYIDPTSFTLDQSILILSMVILGGTGNIKGPIVGAIIIVLLPELLRFLAIPDSFAANLRLIIYGLMLVILMRFRPQGIAGKYRFE